MSENLRDTPAAEKSAFLAVNGGAGLDRGGGGGGGALYNCNTDAGHRRR